MLAIGHDTSGMVNCFNSIRYLLPDFDRFVTEDSCGDNRFASSLEYLPQVQLAAANIANTTVGQHHIQKLMV